MGPIMTALGLDAFGPPVDAATEKPPYRHTRILRTSFPVPAEPGGKNGTHIAVITDDNAARWQGAWTYMLTEKVSGK